MKRMYTDTVSPHAMGMRFAIEYYGIDHIMYGTDYPCWDPATALALLGELDLSAAERQKLFHDNAVRILNLRPPQGAGARAREAALA
jgi:aminocarboxymuconate-semialdehyde decarboxylase